MNATPYLHLCWKEYRSIRLFWLTVVALVVFLQWITATLSPNWLGGSEFNLALCFPALFAAGCAGVAFAGEQEEGTFDFLRACPVRAVQVLVSKLTVPLLATLAMYAVLWLSALIVHGGTNDAAYIHGSMALWCVAAVEVLAWGTLFSLLTARPLLAVILAITAASTETHLLAWYFRESPSGVEFAAYVRAAPWRTLLAVAILAVDVVLGLRWLHGDLTLRKSSKRNALPLPLGEDVSPSPSTGEGRGEGAFPSLTGRGQGEGAVLPLLRGEGRGEGRTASDIPTAENSNATLLPSLLAKRDRPAMLGRLLWQHWRQSWSLMLIVGGLFILMSLMSLGRFGEAFWRLLVNDRFLGPESDLCVPMALFAALMGCCVFLSDQSRRQFRFFVEHNVPPRYVWFTRQLPWLIVLGAPMLLISVAWLRAGSNIWQLWDMMDRAMQGNYVPFDRYRYNGLYMPPLFTGLICSFVAYSAGQFASMLIRSGIIAAVAGVLLAAALCGWTLLMRSLQVPFWWSVWPIPLVLLLATWLRAPDWTRENYRWPAWTRLAASVLVPCAILFTTMAIFRVHQVPVASPGFDVAEYQSQVAQGLATADIYEQAIRKWPLPLDELPAQLKSLGQMPPDILKLAILANQQPICHFLDSVQGKAYNARIYDFNLLSEALFASGQQLAGEGKLDAALNRDFEALQLLNRLYNPEAWGDGQFNYQATGRNNFFTRFTNWAGIKDQTPQRIRDAIQRLQAIHPADLHLDDAVKDEYFIANRAIQGDESANTVFYSGYYRPTTGDFLLTMLMPWERHRADRVLNALTQAELSLMQRVLEVLDGQLSYGADSGRALSLIIAQVQQGSSWALHYLDRISIDIPGVGPTTIRINLAGLVETTIPNLSEINEVASRAISDLLEFEARRRGTMLVLALQAYRLEHGQLPDSLDELKPDYFQTLPPDPYSGLEFRYFPHGLPFNSDDVPNRPYLWTADYVPGVPGIWCTSPYVNASIEHVDTSSDSDEKPKLKDIVAYFQFSWYGPDHEVITPLNSAENAWARGYWFPIPAAQR